MANYAIKYYKNSLELIHAVTLLLYLGCHASVHYSLSMPLEELQQLFNKSTAAHPSHSCWQPNYSTTVVIFNGFFLHKPASCGSNGSSSRKVCRIASRSGGKSCLKMSCQALNALAGNAPDFWDDHAQFLCPVPLRGKRPSLHQQQQQQESCWAPMRYHPHHFFFSPIILAVVITSHST